MITILLLLAAQETACFPATADKLASDDIDIRDQALADLVRRGPKAVPAIRAALAKAVDTELKGRLELALKALTEVRWLDDLDTALKVSAAENKPLLVYVTRGPVKGWT